MKVFVSHQSALEYWRSHRGRTLSCAGQRCRVTLPGNPPITEQVRLTGLTLPLHIMVSNANACWTSKTMRQHVLSGETPPCFFIRTDEGFYVSSPEACYLQMADTLSLIELIELGYELCGAYSLPGEESQKAPERGFYNRQPLARVQSIAAFMARMPGARGRKKALRALRFVLDGSASPMETKLAMLLILPYKLGGYCLEKPELNSRIVPSKTARRSSSKGFYSCDLYWPEYELAVEYDSALFHTGAARIADDSKKRNALTLMGVTVITVTKQQLYSSAEFEKVARVLANCLDKRLVYKNPGFTTVHRELREQLF